MFLTKVFLRPTQMLQKPNHRPTLQNRNRFGSIPLCPIDLAPAIPNKINWNFQMITNPYTLKLTRHIRLQRFRIQPLPHMAHFSSANQIFLAHIEAPSIVAPAKFLDLNKRFLRSHNTTPPKRRISCMYPR